MVCYDPSDCLSLSNCTGVTGCSESRHHIRLLDRVWFAFFLNQTCNGFTCCTIITCPDWQQVAISPSITLLPTTPPTLTSPSTSSAADINSSQLIIGTVVGAITATLLLLISVWRLYRRNNDVQRDEEEIVG